MMATNPDNVGGLPELPVAAASFRQVTACEQQLVFPRGWRTELGEDFYTADQMRAYGEICRAAPAGGDQIGWLNVASKTFYTLAELASTPRNQRLIDAGRIIRVYGDAGPDPWANCRHVDSAPAGSGEVESILETMLCAAALLEQSSSIVERREGAALREQAALLRKLQ